MTQLPELCIVTQVTQTYVYIYIYIYIYISNPWKSNYRDGPTGHKSNENNIITTATSFIMIAIFIDINECTEGISGCSDGCENSPGYFECSCPSGFTLSHEDNKTCIGKRKKNIC